MLSHIYSISNSFEKIKLFSYSFFFILIKSYSLQLIKIYVPWWPTLFWTKQNMKHAFLFPRRWEGWGMVFTTSIAPLKEKTATMILCSSTFHPQPQTGMLRDEMEGNTLTFLIVFPPVKRPSTCHTIIHLLLLLALLVLIFHLPMEYSCER